MWRLSGMREVKNRVKSLGGIILYYGEGYEEEAKEGVDQGGPEEGKS
jgi:hypothetical protein